MPSKPLNSLYGHFDEAAHRFTLTEEGPRKWWNLHCTAIGDHELYSEVCNLGDGRTIARDADGVTVELVSYDKKYTYIRDDETGEVFCPGGGPAPEKIAAGKTHYDLEKTEICGEALGLRAVQRVFVPQHEAIEATTVFIENLTDRPRKLSIFSFVMFSLMGCDKEGRTVWKENIATVHPELGGVYCINRNVKTPTDRFKAFFITLADFYNANGYRDHFTRQEYCLGTPRILFGWDCDGRPGYGPDCAGIVQVKLSVAPRAHARADFLLGQTNSLADVADVRTRITPQRLDELCAEARAVELNRASAFKIDVGSAAYNGLFNIFVKKQLYTYLINKSGFRDNLQTDVPLAMADLPAAENNFLHALASQRPDGAPLHGFRPLNREQFSDKPAWILFTLPELLKERGDLSLLEKTAPYFESSETGTVWDHALRAVRFLARDTGRHGLCDQHHADWNDGLSADHSSGGRESVMVTQQFCYGLREIAAIAERMGDKTVADECRSLFKTFSDRLNTVAWDGEWYTRILCADGYKIGSRTNEEGKIFINSQSWAVISGTAPADRAQLCMDKLEEHLCTDIGYRLCFPPFAKFDSRVGGMTNSMPGANENGGCYNHAAGFKAVADCLLGRGDAAWSTFQKVTPGNPQNPISKSGAEPFSYVNSYSSVPQIYGQSGYAWRTGTAGWMTTLLIEYILGARRDWDGLRLRPCLPSALPTAKLTRRFRGATYEIELHNPQRKSGFGQPRITVDGKPHDTNLLPDFRSGTHQVSVTI